MDNDKDRIKIAQWVLERNLAFISAAEVKVGVLVALNTAMLGTLAAALNPTTTIERSAWGLLFFGIAAICCLSAVICAAMATLPRTVGPHSLLFFSSIQKIGTEAYSTAFKAANEELILDDCLAQISRNSEIACHKFSWVKKGMYWTFLALLPWLLALLFLIKI